VIFIWRLTNALAN